MLWLPPALHGRTETNLTASNRNGTTITTGVAHTKGAYSAGELIAATAEDTFGLTVCASEVCVSATDTSYLLDIGIGASGSERDLIQNLDCWGAGAIAVDGGAKTWFFPVFIAKGERIAARGQAVAATDVAEVAIWCHQAAGGYAMEVPGLWTQLGTITNSDGVTVTPASGAFGSWTAILDPITAPYRWWHVGYGAINDTTIVTGGDVLIEIGFGDTSASVQTIGSWRFSQTATESIHGPFPAAPVYYPVTADTVNGVFARIASHETENRSVVVYGGI